MKIYFVNHEHFKNSKYIYQLNICQNLIYVQIKNDNIPKIFIQLSFHKTTIPQNQSL